MEIVMTIAACSSAGAGPPDGLRTLWRSPTLALTLAALFWSGSFVVGRALHEEIDPVLVTFARWFISLVLFAPFVWRDLARSFPVVVREWRLVAALGATGIALFHPLVYLALQHTSATNALITLSLAPVLILPGASMLARRRPALHQLAGATISLAGAVVLITRGDVAVLTATGLNIGDLWMLAAVALWAAYSLLLRRRPTDLPQTVTLVSSIAVALPLLLAIALLSAPSLAKPVSVPLMLGVAYIAIFGSAIGFLFWSYGVAELGPGRAGQFVHLMPVFGAALAFVFLGEPLSTPQIFGATLVLAGLALIEERRTPQST
jgi:drug/metabolite transporter (DMT)-like permease